MDIQFKTKEEELLFRVFKLIQENYFSDHKMGINYCERVQFDRSLGWDLGDYFQGKFPEYYHGLRRKYAKTQ